MAEPVRLHTVKDRHCVEATELLRELLGRAESGEVIAVTGIIEYADGTYGQFGSATMSRLKTSGALLEAAVKRLGFEEP